MEENEEVNESQEEDQRWSGGEALVTGHRNVQGLVSGLRFLCYFGKGGARH